MKFRKPMLAKNYEGHERHVIYPCYVQPKLDGIRCVTDGVRFWSRNGKLFPEINLRHLQVHGLSTLIDGELMVDKSEHFEDIVSAVKNGSTLDRSLAKRIEFYVFDVLIDEPFKRRRVHARRLIDAAQRVGTPWSRVETLQVDSERMLRAHSRRFLLNGFEGTIIRNANGMYVSKRTIDLLKWKPIQDAEFEIVDVKEARGKDKGTPIFVCRVGLRRFRARPTGTMQQRRKMWRDRRKLIGCQLTVEYQNLTKYGVPRFPRAKVLRDYE